MIRLKDLYDENDRHEWTCFLCGAYGTAYTALWALHNYESHYALKHREAK